MSVAVRYPRGRSPLLWLVDRGRFARWPDLLSRAGDRLARYWYGGEPPPWWLRACGRAYCGLMQLRARGYRRRWFGVCHLPVPVLIIGNLSVGGVGKTPLVIHVVELLCRAGYSPGIVTRGYRGRSTLWPRRASGTGNPSELGDEPVLLARRTGVPVWVGPDRVAAARALVAAERCDVIVADDGLQHYRLGRAIEIAVLDGARGLGNGRCLPAGPLREPAGRLGRVDLVVCNGAERRGAHRMEMHAGAAVRLNDRTCTMPLSELAGHRVHAVAGVGHPQRFFGLLRGIGLRIVEHPFPDHHRFCADDLAFDDDGLILMTEKDAIKCERLRLAIVPSSVWYLPVSAWLDSNFARLLLMLLRRRARG